VLATRFRSIATVMRAGLPPVASCRRPGLTRIGGDGSTDGDVASVLLWKGERVASRDGSPLGRARRREVPVGFVATSTPNPL